MIIEEKERKKYCSQLGCQIDDIDDDVISLEDSSKCIDFMISNCMEAYCKFLKVK